MNIYISVVSHGHSDLITKLSCIEKISESLTIVVKSNKVGDNFDKLLSYSNFHWINGQYGCGFGHNNNIIFNYCRSNLGMSEQDYFVVMNPDIVIEESSISQLIKNMKNDGQKLSAINLFKDSNWRCYDNSIRKFPSILQFVKSFIGFRNSSILDKSNINKPCKVDWAAGSFLVFEACHYSELGGFDERYFMYCEDIDICYRSSLLGIGVQYYPDIKAMHLAQHENRNVFSKHFVWHVTSVVRFLFTRIGLTRTKSSLTP